MKKILLIVPSKKNGGGINVVANEIRDIYRKKSYIVEVLYLKGPGCLSALEESEFFLIPDSQSIINKIVNRIILKSKFNDFIQKHGSYQLVISFGFLPGIVAADSINQNLVITQHAAISTSFDNIFLKKYYYHKIIKLYPKVKRVITISNDMAQELTKIVKLNNQQTIYNPLNILEIKEQTRHLTPKIQEKNFVYVGRLAPEKRVDLLINAFSKYLNMSNDEGVEKLLLVGDGPELNKLKLLVHNLKLSNNVVFTGNVKNPYNYILNAQALFLISKVEGFPNVLVEAITLKTPVVSVDIPSGPYEIVTDSQERKQIEYPLVTKNGILLENVVDNELINEVVNAMLSIKELSFTPELTIINRKNIINEYLKLVE
ncbi:glycosyltransferase [uncultured Leuconostoc sp.]|uniref:glycosyltransferase n=1 Tax=uncultured Leuconostoc sp. TaxID=173262 RepID=UPI002804975D|nr:glycosyltransferase [uncultured Leuconostoc sp.]